ncbi:uncharacterized protein KGF55_004103 [Candida pseudojiufengensis]|uniref:uncharacterized protein n=1 Tax=Candida pseudojiufengensis TaxID=497109 RepID=UPI0022246ACE|nr:uncharacterized protein KGF55_004103 [Candida pseudojiufengensis]KAI5961178.1 hypothetical protein KGF55_004103 [Candida pseudojiufengensis]
MFNNYINSNKSQVENELKYHHDHQQQSQQSQIPPHQPPTLNTTNQAPLISQQHSSLGQQLPLNLLQVQQMDHLQQAPHHLLPSPLAHHQPLQGLQNNHNIQHQHQHQQVQPPLSQQPSLGQLPTQPPQPQNIPILKSSFDMRKSKSGNDGFEDKTCQFCDKQFSQKGSLLRHLDTRKGDSLHPIDKINFIRSNSVRRRSVDVTSASDFAKTPGTRKRRASKKSMARSQMSSDSASGQKEKSKLRRKLRDRRIKAKLISNEWMIDKFTKQTLPDLKQQPITPSTFCFFIAFYVPIKVWPSLSVGYPTTSLYEEVINRINDQEVLVNIFNQSIQSYEQLGIEDKRRLWLEQIQYCLNSSINEINLHDLNNIKSIVEKKEQNIFEEICSNDNLSAFVDIEENHTVEEEEDEDDEQSSSQPSTRSNSLPQNIYLPHLPNQEFTFNSQFY